jgi:alpha-glucosidase
MIYPRSFLDTDGDGVGDLEGIRRRLDYLVWLGVDALWICPFYPSPMADFGYDVSDYTDVDPVFGTLDDFDRLLAEAHQRGLKVILDWVPNHTSDQHEWFVESRSSRDNPKRDWYVWRDRPNNWKAAFGGEAWTYDDATGQWYLHLFLPEQPDLDWRKPQVARAMHETLRFWLDRGVDGFRIDVVQGLTKDPDLPDDPDGLLLPHSAVNDCDDTHEVLRGIRRVTDAYGGERVLVGEVYLLSTRRVARYLGRGDELHLAFDFTTLFAPWDATAWRRRLQRAAEELEPIGAWPTLNLSNQDNPRHRTRYGSEARARAAAVLLLTARGTPFLYYGEELGLEDAVVPSDRVLDRGGRDGCRAPFPWDGTPGHGWAAEEAWLPWPPDAGVRHAAALAADEGSILHLYRRTIAVRRASAALRGGAQRMVESPDGVLAFEREADGDRRLVIVNFTCRPSRIVPDGDWTVEVASDGVGEGRPFDGDLRPDVALVLRRA